MKKTTLAVLVGVCVLAAMPVLAQMPTGTLTGQVADPSGPLPGVAITITSPNLQGARTAITSANGDYIFTSLPPGLYKSTFELSGFQTVEVEVKVSASQTAQVDVDMTPAMTEEITVTGRYETISSGTQASTTYESDFIEKLPTGRDLDNVVLMAPGVTNTGPSQGITVSGAMSYESLFMVNGVVLNENLRGQGLPLYIEDALQETTISTAGVSAEYGRFSGGIVNALTKSGGNEFEASFRVNLTNDKWVSKTPLTVEQEDKINKTYEATFGGRILRDRLWFFLAGRDRSISRSDQTNLTNIPYPYKEDEKRYEGKLTLAITPEHRVVGSYIERTRDQFNNYYTSATILDLASLYDRSMPEDLMAINYSGAFGSNLFAEVQYSRRQFTFENSGSRYTDLIYGTLLVNRANSSHRWWAPTFCGVCTPEERDNENIVAKGTWFLSTQNMGSHDIAFGYDTFDDVRSVNNHQSGSDFRIYLTPKIVGTDVYASLVPNNSYLMWNPILIESRGNDFRTNSYFINDKWRLNQNWSFNVGVRYDKNDGVDAERKTVVDDAKISPRLGVNWDPTGDGTWNVHASYADYVMSIANNQADASSAAGSPATYTWTYTGPAVNATAPYLSTEDVLNGFWAWFTSIGGTNNTTYRSSPSIPGYTVIVDKTLRSPYGTEYALGATRRLGSHGVARMDYIHREYGDFYVERLDMTTGTKTTPVGVRSNVGIVENDDSLLSRTYDGVQLSANYRLERWTVGGNYTWSHTYGNFDGESSTGGPTRSTILRYPEYRDLAWWAPSGDLSIDQRHKARVFVTWDALTTKYHSLNVSVLQNFWSGTPYGASGAVDARPSVTNPGYITPPSTVTYWYEKRDTYRTDDITRTDLAVNYAFHVPVLGTNVEIFLQPEVINVFNERGVEVVDTTVYDRTTDSTLTTFNPFTTQPVEGVNWRKGEDFGHPTEEADYQTPRTFRFSIGFRF